MSPIKHRQPNATPEIEYGEIYIPDDKNIGTGMFTTLLKSNALSQPRAIMSIVINKPKFQISVNINPITREVPVLLGRVDGTDPVSQKTFLIPKSVNATVAHKFIARFEDWQITGLELDGKHLVDKSVQEVVSVPE